MISFIIWWAADKLGLVLCQQYGSQPSVSQLERVVQTQCGITTSEMEPNIVLYVSVKSTVMLSVLLVNLASYTGKNLFTWWSWRTSRIYKYQYRAFILSHMYQVLRSTLVWNVCCAFWVCVRECISGHITAYLCARVHKTFNPGSPGGALH